MNVKVTVVGLGYVGLPLAVRFAQKGFYISSKDDAKDLERKTQKLEYKTYAEAIINLYRYD